MRMKTIKILAAVTGPAAILALLLPAPGSSTGTADQGGGGPLLVPGLKGHTDTLAQIAITGADGTVTLSRTPVAGKPAYGWTLRNKGGYPVPAATIKPVIDGLVALHGVSPRTDRPDSYGRLDLGDPAKGSASHLVALVDARGGPLGSIVLGKAKAASGAGNPERIYARVPGSVRSWLAAPAITLPTESIAWVNRTVVDIDANKVREVVLTQPGNPPLDFIRDKSGDKLTVRDVPAGRKLTSDTPGSDIQVAFTVLDLDDVKPEAQLGGGAAGNVHLVTFNGVVADFALRKDNGQTWITVSATGSKEAQDITARTKGWAYQIPSDRADTLLATMASLTEPVKK